jgi:uncharacterized C2H2 Zn-finger protein
VLHRPLKLNPTLRRSFRPWCLFHYEPDCQVLICRRHEQAVKGLKRHLEDAPGLKKERQAYLDHYAGLELARPGDVPLPPANGPAFEALGEPRAAFQCITCSHISTNRKPMRGHCNKKHGWKTTESAQRIGRKCGFRHSLMGLISGNLLSKWSQLRSLLEPVLVRQMRN